MVNSSPSENSEKRETWGMGNALFDSFFHPTKKESSVLQHLEKSSGREGKKMLMMMAIGECGMRSISISRA